MSQQPGQPPEYPGPAYPEPGPRRQHRAPWPDDPYGTGEAGRHGSGQPPRWRQDHPESGRGVPGWSGDPGAADPVADPGRYRPDPERYGPGWNGAADPGADPGRHVPGWSGGDGTAGAGAGSERYRPGAQRHDHGAEQDGYGSEGRGVGQESYWPGVADYGSGDAGAERAGDGADRGGWPGVRHPGNRPDEPPYGADRGVHGRDAGGATTGWRAGGFGADRRAGGFGNTGGPADHQAPGAVQGPAGRQGPTGIQWSAGAEGGGRPTGPGGDWPPGGGSGIGSSGSRRADQTDDTWFGFGDSSGSQPGGGSSVPGPGRPGDERPEGGRRGAAPREPEAEPEPYDTGRGDGTGGRPGGAWSGGGRRAAGGRRAGEAGESSGGAWSGGGERAAGGAWSGGGERAAGGRRAGEAGESSGGAWSGGGERAAGGRRSRAARRSGEPAATASDRPDLAAPPGRRRAAENDPGREEPEGERPPQEPARRNTLALVAFITGVVGLVPVAIACGLIALSQLKKRPRRGRLLAVGGLAFSGAWALVILTVITLTVLDLPKGEGAGGKTGGSSVSSFELAPGDCLNGLKESQGVARVPTVPCTEKHEGEVFALFTLTAKSWPGDATVLRQAEDGCGQRLAEYSSKAVNDPKLEIFFLHPTENSWKTGDRAVTCVAVDQATRTGSLRS